ncbi:peptidoglycan-recognition protein SA [Drosophila tropicalis]|uniref:peptidoglycan-recognition protein SA n=1 Tax=Drosophila tropicalis TaxID=46794 RepID=UPI0035ABBB3B
MLSVYLPLLILVIAQVQSYRPTTTDGRSCPQIKLKSQWGGKPPRGDLYYQVRPIRFVVIHHTVTSECAGFLECAEILQNIQSYAQNELNYNDISYNFLIGNDGVVYEGTGWGVRGAHTYGYNANGTGIAFIGNYSNKLPSPAALKAAQKLLICGVKQDELSNDYALIAASQVITTQSPGLILYNEIQGWPNWVSDPQK